MRREGRSLGEGRGIGTCLLLLLLLLLLGSRLFGNTNAVLTVISCRYFGRARELPGVKELFEAAKAPSQSQQQEGPTRAELRRNVDASYYGYNLDEEDGSLLAYERQKEEEAFANLMQQPDDLEVDAPSTKGRKGRRDQDEWMELPGDAGDGVGWVLPSLDEVQEELVERRRRKLLDKLGG